MTDSSSGDEVTPWDLAREVTREALCRRPSMVWLAFCVAIAAGVTVSIAHAGAPWQAYIIPGVIIVSAFLAGTKDEGC